MDTSQPNWSSPGKWSMRILSWIWSPILVAQIILVLFMGRYNVAEMDAVMWTGWAIWAISVLFGFMPIFQFRKKGEVPRGKSYVHTTRLVVTGLYSIIRHPQYTAGILFSIALMLISQDLLVLLLGIVIIPVLYADMVIADRHELAKFGDTYRQYMREVPRANFILGIIRRLTHRNGSMTTQM